MIGAHQISQNIPKLTPMVRVGNRTLLCVTLAKYRTQQGTVFPTPATPDRFRRNPPSPSLVRLGYGVSPPLVIAETYDVH